MMECKRSYTKFSATDVHFCIQLDPKRLEKQVLGKSRQASLRSENLQKVKLSLKYGNQKRYDSCHYDKSVLVIDNFSILNPEMVCYIVILD